jgi:hypothetical protein
MKSRDEMISKKKAYQIHKKRCPAGPNCGHCLRRVWLSKKYGYYYGLD